MSIPGHGPKSTNWPPNARDPVVLRTFTGPTTGCRQRGSLRRACGGLAPNFLHAGKATRREQPVAQRFRPTSAIESCAAANGGRSSRRVAGPRCVRGTNVMEPKAPQPSARQGFPALPLHKDPALSLFGRRWAFPARSRPVPLGLICNGNRSASIVRTFVERVHTTPSVISTGRVKVRSSDGRIILACS
jgi:hypothetical protein